jgi:hypothetical protein
MTPGNGDDHSPQNDDDKDKDEQQQGRVVGQVLLRLVGRGVVRPDRIGEEGDRRVGELVVGSKKDQPAVSSSGAVSLIEIAIATSRPGTIPGTADFSTILRSVQETGRARAPAPSR